MSAIEITIPDIGDFKNVPITELHVKPGDVVAIDDILLVVESDKANLEIPSPRAGTVKTLSVAVGDRVSEGSPILRLEPAEAPVSPPPPAAAPAAEPAAEPALVSAPPSISANADVQITVMATDDQPPHASPSIRRFARELGIDLHLVSGTGAKGRIQKQDVENFVKIAISRPPSSIGGMAGQGLDLLPWPQIDFAKFGPIEREPLSKIRKISGANLVRNAVIIPHVTNFDEADVTALEAFRQKVNEETGSKATILSFLIKAAITALKKFPTLNASLDGDDLILKRYFHMGFAADTPEGLVVPVIHDADTMGVLDIAAELARLSALARNGKLKPGDMQGGSFTVSSLGGIGGTGFTPIINAPEVAILGAARAQMKPVWDGTQFQPRLIMPLSLSWDHRVIDGAVAARFLVHLSSLLADFRRISL